MTSRRKRAPSLPFALLALFGAVQPGLSGPPAGGGDRPAAVAAIEGADEAESEPSEGVAPDAAPFWEDVRHAPAAAIVVLGAAGTSHYRTEFAQTADLWVRAARHSRIPCVVVPPTDDSKRRLRTLLDRLATDDARTGETPPEGEAANGSPTAFRASRSLWLVLIGHGTFDGRSAKFNLAGADVSAGELAQWLNQQRRTMVVVCGFSCSGAFLPELSAPRRIVVTATKSGTEHLYSRFGRFFAEAITSSEGDLDKDGRTSVWEAFLASSRRTARYYRTRGRLATEHALLDDNGDGRGVRAEWFEGLYPRENIAAQGSLDGIVAHQMHLVAPPQYSTLSDEQRTLRQRLETELRALRAKRSRMTEADYLDALERIFLQLADVYEAADRLAAGR